MCGALGFWKQAMKERLCDSQNIVLKPDVTSSIAAYENAVEVRSLADLDKIAVSWNIILHCLLKCRC